MTLRYLRLVLVALGMMGAVSVLHAADDDDFKKGLDQLKDGKYTDAIQSFGKAIQADPKESSREVTTGRVIVLRKKSPYLPYQFLGEAYHKADQCAAALSSWDSSELQGVVKKYKERMEAIDTGRRECVAKGFLLKEALDKEDDAIRDLVRQAEATARQKRAGRTDLSPAERGVFEEVSGLRSQLDRARAGRRASDFKQVRTGVDRALAELNAIVIPVPTPIKPVVTTPTQPASQAWLDDAKRRLARSTDLLREVQGYLGAAPLKGAASAALISGGRSLAETLGGLSPERLEKAAHGGSDEMASIDKSLNGAGADGERLRDRALNERRALDEGQSRKLKQTIATNFTSIDEHLAGIRTAAASLTPDERVQVEGMLSPIEPRLTALKKRAGLVLPKGQKPALTEVESAQRAIDEALIAVMSTVESLRPPEIPESLSLAVDLYLNRKYQDAADAIPESMAGALDSRLAPHAYAVRAASLFALYEYSGRKDEARLQEARRAVDAAKAAQTEFQPAEAVFGPKFVRFFGQPSGK